MFSTFEKPVVSSGGDGKHIVKAEQTGVRDVGGEGCKHKAMD